MDSRGGFLDQLWASEQPLNDDNGRFAPVTDTFSDDLSNLAVSGQHINEQLHSIVNGQEQHSVVFPHDLDNRFGQPQYGYSQPPAPLIPLSAVEDLQLDNPYTSGGFQDPFNRTFANSLPVVHEGYIPAPGQEEEDDYPTLPAGYRDSLFHDHEYQSSEDDNEYERMLAEEEMLREIEDQDDPEKDKDYSEDEEQQDQGDLDDLEVGEDFEDEDRPRRGRPSTRGMRGRGRGWRGGRGRGRGTTPGRGRGGGSTRDPLSTRGRKRGGKPGRPSGRRGPRPVADPGHEFKELQRHANERFIAHDYQTALEYAQKAVQLNPEIFDAHNIVSEIYGAMGEELKSIEALIIGAPTKRDPGLWHFIIERVNKLDTEEYPTYTDDAKTAVVLECLNQIILLDLTNYEARSHKLEIEARLGHVSKCVQLGRKMLKQLKEDKKGPDTEVLKIIAMMGTSSRKHTKLHLDKIIECFDEAIEVFTGPKRNPTSSDLDWELINIYLDLLDRTGKHDNAISRLKALSRWKQGRRDETYWDDQQDDREFDIEDAPRRITVLDFRRTSQDAKYGQTLPLEIRAKLGLFRLRNSASDFTEAMHHLEMLEPDDHSPGALVWDYEDIFRIVADALHATGHDKEALRFYEPLYRHKSQELGLMSFMGIYTCYKNQEETEKAEQIITIMKNWDSETLDDLAVLAKFFEDHGMREEAMQRAEAVYRNRAAYKLRKLGFKAHDELREYYFNVRRQARGKHSVRKSTVKKNRRLMNKATGTRDPDANEDDSGNEDINKALPSLGPLSERPTQGLFRMRRSAPKPSKAQTFLPVEPANGPVLQPEPQPGALEGLGVPVEAIDHRIFRRKLESLAREFPDELTAARAQHREIVTSFKRLDEISDAAEDRDQDAVNEVISITRELIEEFSSFDLFYDNRKDEFNGYFRRVGTGDLWKESALMVLAVVANNVEDGETDPELKERPDNIPDDFWGVPFDKWCDAFGRYAILLATEGDDQRCFSTLDIAMRSNIFHRMKDYHQQLELCRLVCALAVDDSNQASSAVRWLLRKYPFGSDLFRLYSCVNRLCSFPEGFASGPAHKVLMRYIKTMDYALLTPEQRIWYNFRDNSDKAAWFRNAISSEIVDAVKDHDPALFALYAHVLMCGGSYMAALNYYFRALAIAPEDPILNLSIGVAYIQHAMKRLSENRQFQIQQSLAFMHRYYELRTKDGVAVHCQEAEFNVGRMWHSLGLVTQALPAYERCIYLSKRVKSEAEDRCSDGEWGVEDFATEAAFALQSIYAVTGNLEGARRVTEEVLVIE
ncbi:TPR-like protein [Dothidotthia symphoricarpi CBS 119687]|uniref:TPR-like protein n=1 Tax=Dothidotthia symphoricarpi CBS 119687 TaxID=1392245 RepID=A0A6A6AF74_9PLEO|nr:TPR-like protein [Dothidotthia symphoricarpi CBS 119687]KAF2129943.1 TPR-like protein [Dothidotthia symphoricarpi CBS 119687]